MSGRESSLGMVEPSFLRSLFLRPDATLPSHAGFLLDSPAAGRGPTPLPVSPDRMVLRDRQPWCSVTAAHVSVFLMAGHGSTPGSQRLPHGAPCRGGPAAKE